MQSGVCAKHKDCVLQTPPTCIIVDYEMKCLPKGEAQFFPLCGYGDTCCMCALVQQQACSSTSGRAWLEGGTTYRTFFYAVATGIPNLIVYLH